MRTSNKLLAITAAVVAIILIRGFAVSLSGTVDVIRDNREDLPADMRRAAP